LKRLSWSYRMKWLQEINYSPTWRSKEIPSKKEYRSGLKYFDQALAIYSGSVNTRHRKMFTHDSLWEIQASIDVWKKILNTAFPEDENTIYFLAQIFLKDKKPNYAISLWEKLLEIDFYNQDYHDLISSAKENNKYYWAYYFYEDTINESISEKYDGERFGKYKYKFTKEISRDINLRDSKIDWEIIEIIPWSSQVEVFWYIYDYTFDERWYRVIYNDSTWRISWLAFND
jgi:tetratricopeptide (TPR) repeat protein